eukprot:tig00021312_g20046.t1
MHRALKLSARRLARGIVITPSQRPPSEAIGRHDVEGLGPPVPRRAAPVHTPYVPIPHLHEERGTREADSCGPSDESCREQHLEGKYLYDKHDFERNVQVNRHQSHSGFPDSETLDPPAAPSDPPCEPSASRSNSPLHHNYIRGDN